MSKVERPTLLERYSAARIARVLDDPTTHFWLRAALRTALTKDPVDALNDSRLLFHLMQERWQAILEAENDEQYKGWGSDVRRVNGWAE